MKKYGLNTDQLQIIPSFIIPKVINENIKQSQNNKIQNQLPQIKLAFTNKSQIRQQGDFSPQQLRAVQQSLNIDKLYSRTPQSFSNSPKRQIIPNKHKLNNYSNIYQKTIKQIYNKIDDLKTQNNNLSTYLNDGFSIHQLKSQLLDKSVFNRNNQTPIYLNNSQLINRNKLSRSEISHVNSYKKKNPTKKFTKSNVGKKNESYLFAKNSYSNLIVNQNQLGVSLEIFPHEDEPLKLTKINIPLQPSICIEKANKLSLKDVLKNYNMSKTPNQFSNNKDFKYNENPFLCNNIKNKSISNSNNNGNYSKNTNNNASRDFAHKLFSEKIKQNFVVSSKKINQVNKQQNPNKSQDQSTVNVQNTQTQFVNLRKYFFRKYERDHSKENEAAHQTEQYSKQVEFKQGSYSQHIQPKYTQIYDDQYIQPWENTIENKDSIQKYNQDLIDD